MSRTCSSRRGKPQSASSDPPGLPLTPSQLPLFPLSSPCPLTLSVFVWHLYLNRLCLQAWLLGIILSQRSWPVGLVPQDVRWKGRGLIPTQVSTIFKIQFNYASLLYFLEGQPPYWAWERLWHHGTTTPEVLVGQDNARYLYSLPLEQSFLQKHVTHTCTCVGVNE